MLTEQQLPSSLISPSERPPIAIRSPHTPTLARTFKIVRYFLELLTFLARNKWQNLDHRIYAARLRCVLEELGSVWLKVGQLLATRGDLMPAEIRAELAKIRDTGQGVAFSEIQSSITEAAGSPLESIYAQFDEKPFATTSLTQLHRAFLRHEQRLVAVKVHKPFIEAVFAQDIKLMQWVIKILDFFSIYPALRWDELCVQAKEMTQRELDSRYEESSLRRLKKKLQPHGVYVPDTFRRYSGQRVLVMEFIRAALMSDFIALQQNDPTRLQHWLKDNNIQPKRVAKRLFSSVYRQIFEDNLFHADMHPGNVVLLRDSRIAVLDCRRMSSMEAELLDKYRICLQSIASQNYATAADIYLLLTSRLPAVDVSIVKADLVRIWRRWHTQTYIKGIPYAEKSMTYMFLQVNKIAFQHHFIVQWPLSKMSMALSNLDASLNALSSELNYRHYLLRYFHYAHRRGVKQQIRQMPKRLPRSLDAAAELPKQIAEFTLFQQSILRRQAQSVQGKTTSTGYVISTFFSLATLFFFCLCGFCSITFFTHCMGGSFEFFIGKQLANIVSALPNNCLLWSSGVVVSGFLFLLCRRLKKRFEQIEIMIPDIHAAI